MADAPLTIDTATVFDNVDEARVEFAALADGERHAFAAQYDLLRALSGEEASDRPVALFHTHADRIAAAAARALGRDVDQPLIVVSENDLD